MTSLGLAAETDSPSWVAVHPNKRFLYAANELPPAEAGGPEGAVTAFAIDQATGKLTADQPLEDQRARASAPAGGSDRQVGHCGELRHGEWS